MKSAIVSTAVHKSPFYMNSAPTSEVRIGICDLTGLQNFIITSSGNSTNYPDLIRHLVHINYTMKHAELMPIDGMHI